MKQFLIPKFEIREAIRDRVKYLERIRTEIAKELDKMPSGKITILKNGSSDGYSYYFREHSSDKNGMYLNRSKIKFRNALGQKRYYEKLLKNIEIEYSKLVKIESWQLEDSIISTYEDLNEGLKRIINPVNVDDQSIEERWYSKEYKGLPFSEDDKTEYFSEKKERMRSKSEVLIANSLYRRGIVYKYEYPLEIPNGKTRYPDFTIFISAKRKIFYWEHLGKIGDSDYINANLKKLSEYRDAGINIGDNLILSYESGNIPLGTKEIDRIIDGMIGQN